MLQHRDPRRHTSRDGVGDIPDLLLVEDGALVDGLDRAGHGADLGAFFAGRAEADQGAGDGAQLGELVGVAQLDLLDGAVVVFVHEQQVDQTHDIVVYQAPELVESRARELRVLAVADHQDLYRTQCHLASSL